MLVDQLSVIRLVYVTIDDGYQKLWGYIAIISIEMTARLENDVVVRIFNISLL